MYPSPYETPPREHYRAQQITVGSTENSQNDPMTLQSNPSGVYLGPPLMQLSTPFTSFTPATPFRAPQRSYHASWGARDHQRTPWKNHFTMPSPHQPALGLSVATNWEGTVAVSGTGAAVEGIGMPIHAREWEEHAVLWGDR